MLKQPSTLNYTCIFCNSLAVIVIVQIHAHHHMQIVTACSSGLHFGLQAPNIHRLRAPTEPGSPFLTRRSNHQKLQVKLRVESALMLFTYAIGISCLSSQSFGILWFGCPARQNSHANKKQFCAPDAMNSVGIISPSPLSKNLSHRRIQVEIWST